MKTLAERYAPSSRAYVGLPDLSYPLHDRDIIVTNCGRICMHRKKINISHVLAGQKLGIKEVDDGALGPYVRGVGDQLALEFV
jgi:hypothetical protein